MTDTTLPVPLLEVRDLQKYYPIKRGLLKRTVGQVRAVDGISFSIMPHETLALVGESGCGKSTTGYCIMRLLQTTGGEILFRNGSAPAVRVDQLARRDAKSYLRQVQIIFQNPYSSLDPRMSIADIVAEPLRIHNAARGRELEERVAYLLQSVGLQARHLRYYPHAFSGGQRQRIGIARALSLQPKMLICDEPVSALDVSIQAQVLNLLLDLQQNFGLTYLFISHDLGVVHHISNRVAVMYVGKIVEVADTDDLFTHPLHPYTEALLAAVPKARPGGRRKRHIVRGEVPNPADPPPGCRFHTRCPYAQARCKEEEPPLRELSAGHHVSCHFAEQLDLRGIAVS
jgi:peptide/nickel transport system ATP-binding protein